MRHPEHRSGRRTGGARSLFGPASAANPLQALRDDATASNGIDILVGPEGGFAEEERSVLLRQPRILRLSLGPRVLRADTAAVAALALVQAALGDWTRPADLPG